MTTSANLAITHMVANQDSAEVTFNNAINLLETFATHVVLDKDLAAAPGSPADGTMYIVAGTPSDGIWDGESGNIALYYNGWYFIPATEGLTVDVIDEDLTYRYDGSNWVLTSTAPGVLFAFRPLQVEPPAANYATVNTSGTQPTLDFDDGTDESGYFTGVLAHDYGGGTIRVHVLWAGVAIVNEVRFDISFKLMGVEAINVDTGFATAQSGDSTANGTTLIPVDYTDDFTQAEADTLLAGSPFRLLLNRDANHVNDDFVGDARVLFVWGEEL